MIQRIQSLYLVIAALLLTLVLFYPIFIFITSDNEIYHFFHYGLIKLDVESTLVIYNNYALSVLLIITLVLIILTLFDFRNRIRQIKSCKLTIFFLFAILLIQLWLFFKLLHDFENFQLTFQSFCVPLSIILIWLAQKAINKDEQLVRSADRIR